MVRAQAEGLVDFSQADLLDPRWHTRLALLISELVARDQREISLRHHNRALAYLAVANIKQESFKKFQESEQETLEDYLVSLLGLPQAKGDRKKRMAQKLRDSWAREFGDPTKPETQKKIDKVAEGLRMQRMQNPARRTQSAK